MRLLSAFILTAFLCCHHLCAQDNTLKHAMFKDLAASASITVSYRDSSYTFYTKAVEKNTCNDLSKRYFWYHQGEFRSTMGGCSGKLIDGVFEKYDRSGILLEKGKFKAGLKTGRWLSWYTDGSLKGQLSYKQGVRHGKFTSNYATGQVWKQGRYRKDQLHGKLMVTASSGKTESHTYKKGKLIIPKPPKVKAVKDKGEPKRVKEVKPEEASPASTEESKSKKGKKEKASAEEKDKNTSVTKPAKKEKSTKKKRVPNE